MKKTIFILCAILSFGALESQTIKGKTLEYVGENKTQVLPFASIYWMGTNEGTTSDENGIFSINRIDGVAPVLVVRYTGYVNDTIPLKDGQTEITIVMAENISLAEVEVIARVAGSYVSRMNPIKTEVISSTGLCQLACCNLAESFENSATVDVGYSDAVSGARQIQMLGLTGLYSQILYENMPFLRGLSAPYGLSYVPGSFMESIQISKGTSSVLNGFEAISGQINLEYRKPQTADPLFINLYLNNELRTEANIIGNIRINDRLGTTIFANGTFFDRELDHLGQVDGMAMNHDGFIDMPKNKHGNFINRWSYDGDRYRNVTTLMAVIDDRQGGQVGFDPSIHKGDTVKYGFANRTNRYQLFTKNGYQFSDKFNIGTQVSATYLDQKAYYGLRVYDAIERNLYANIILDHTLKDNHKLHYGVSYQFNDVTERVSLIPEQMQQSERYEHIPGVFTQYSFTLPEKFNLVAGLRYDYNTMLNEHMVTPRMHLKWDVTPMATIRASAGRGYRAPYVFSENIGLMASSREFVIQNPIGMEQAWNYGLSYMHTFDILENSPLTLSLDFFRTDFVSQVLVDLYADAHQARIGMLDGKSFSNSVQLELKWEAIPEHYTVTAAGRFNDVKATYDGVLREKPYVSRWKMVLVQNFRSNMNKWMFDWTININGKMKLPNTNGLRPDVSDRAVIMHAQLTRRFRFFDIYIGCENILNEVQNDPIIAANDPFGPNFDATVIWGSLMMRTFYLGVRFTL